MTRARVLSWLAVTAVFAGALGVRLVKLSEPPLDFHPTRQYRSALLARRYFLEGQVAVPAWRTQLARANAEEVYEPPLMERAAAFGYRQRGREDLRIPRALSIASWLVAGAFVYALARRIAGPHGALVAVSFFLFAPFGVEASRSFQPDPAMVMWIAASALALLRYGERPKASTLALAGICGALAVLTKPMALFPVVGAFAGVTWARRGDLGRRAPV